MPKRKKPAGGRPARHFDPYRGSKRGSGKNGRFGAGDRRSGAGKSEKRSPKSPGSSRAPGTTSRAPEQVRRRLESTMVRAADVQDVSFSGLGVGQNIVRTLGELGAESPFPIQAATIPDVLEGHNVLGRGRTGSGKTIAFGVPAVERLMQNRGGTKRAEGRSPRALILAPTRELALQIDRTVQPIARCVGLFTTQIYGGVPQARQVGALKRGVDIVIGTPGRIEDLCEQGKLDLSDVMVTVIDEADHMCALGFLEPVQRIVRSTRRGGQRLLFSATLDEQVLALVDEFLPDPRVYEVPDEGAARTEHRVIVSGHDQKPTILTELVREQTSRGEKTLVFTRTRAYAEQLVELLNEQGVRARPLHGDLSQERRQHNLRKFASGAARVLVATDVAARGIHVDDIALVVQADMADGYKTYLHRSGRTARAGRSGRVITIVSPRQRERMQEILRQCEVSARTVDARADGPAAVRAVFAESDRPPS